MRSVNGPNEKLRLNGPRPTCVQCGLREAASRTPGARCENCRTKAFQRKKVAEQNDEMAALAGALKKADPTTYRDIFIVVNRLKKSRTASAHLLRLALLALHREEAAGRRPRDLWEYFAGTVRKLRTEDEAKELRTGRGPSLLGDILDRAQGAMNRAPTRTKR